MKAEAMVQVGVRQLERRTIAVPEPAAGEAVLRVEATGICGSDHDQYTGELAAAGWSTFPVIPGHEPVGTVMAIGDDAATLWGLQTGDRVAVESVVPCHACGPCLARREKFCENRFSYGFTSLELGCGLWGGFSTHLVLRPGSRLHAVPADLDPAIATLFNPLGAGFDWAVRRAELRPGDDVLVLGAGQRGLACVIAARAAGAGFIAVTGLGRDRAKLELARTLGADAAFVVDELDDVVAAVRAATPSGFVDRAVDTTPGAGQPLLDAIELVRPEGVVVVAGLKGNRPMDGFLPDRVVLKAIDVRGVVSVGSWGYEQALRLLVGGRHSAVTQLHSQSVALDEVVVGIERLRSAEAVHVAVAP